MNKILKLDSVAQYTDQRGQETLHPLVSVLDQSKSTPIKPTLFMSELYIIFLKDIKCNHLKYGRNRYDYQNETLLFIAPRQVVGLDTDEKTVQPNGWAVAFHPDLIHGTSLGRHINDYGFFGYNVNEALHLSAQEKQIVLECFHKIQYELTHAIDKHSRTLIVSNIELFLNYCRRFYDRQFITRDTLHRDVLEKFEGLLTDYFQSDKPRNLGLPSVSFCADQLHLSANYFGDLVKKEAGKSPQEYIQAKLIEVAKEKIFDSSKSISEIAYELGFNYPQHFTRLFKKRVGQSPSAYMAFN